MALAAVLILPTGVCFEGHFLGKSVRRARFWVSSSWIRVRSLIEGLLRSQELFFDVVCQDLAIHIVRFCASHSALRHLLYEQELSSTIIFLRFTLVECTGLITRIHVVLWCGCRAKRLE